MFKMVKASREYSVCFITFLLIIGFCFHGCNPLPSSQSSTQHQASNAAAAPDVTPIPETPPGPSAEEKIKEQWLQESKEKINWTPSLTYNEKLTYATGFSEGTVTYYSSAWTVDGSLKNETSFPIQLGETLMVYEDSYQSSINAAGCLKRMGILDEIHTTDIEDRYYLDGRDEFRRGGERARCPMAGGKSTIGIDPDTGLPSDALSYVIALFNGQLPADYPPQKYEGFGFGQAETGQNLTIAGILIVGRLVQRELLSQVLLVSPSIALDNQPQLPRVRLLAHFRPVPKTEQVELDRVECIVIDIDTLKTMIDDSGRSGLERFLAVTWLSELKEPSAVSMMRALVQSTTPASAQRSAAAYGLDLLQDTESIPVLRQALQESKEQPILAARCTMALAHMNVREAAEDLIPYLTARPFNCGYLFLMAADQFANPVLADSVLDILKDNSLTEIHARAAAAAAKCVNANTVPTIEKLVLAAEKMEKGPLYALSSLNQINTAEAYDSLVKVASSDKPAAVYAIRYLGEKKTQDALDKLKNFLKTPKLSKDKRNAVFNAIAKTNMPEAYLFLFELLIKADADTQKNILSALDTAYKPLVEKGGLDAEFMTKVKEGLKKPSLDTLSTLAGNRDAAISAYALEMLGLSKAEDSIQKIDKRLIDECSTATPNADILRVCPQALVDIGNDAAKDKLRSLTKQFIDKKKWKFVKSLIAPLSLACGLESAPLLMDILKDKDSAGQEVRGPAMDALSKMKARDALPAIVAEIEAGKSNALQPTLKTAGGTSINADEIAAINALAAFDLRDQNALLRELTRSQDTGVCMAARKALAEFGETEIVPDMLKELHSAGTYDVGEIAEVLGMTGDITALSALKKEAQVYSYPTEVHKKIETSIKMIEEHNK
jgi:hypothetical protein